MPHQGWLQLCVSPILRGRAAGETINPNMHELGADVTGVTLHRLQVVQTANGWEAPVLLDV